MDSDRDTLAGGLPHSEIRGSKSARLSPRLFAACHVLHRLSVPRHPPDALIMRLIATLLSLAPAHAFSRPRTRRLVKTLFPQGNPTAADASRTSRRADRLGHAHTSSSPCQTALPLPKEQDIAGQATAARRQTGTFPIVMLRRRQGAPATAMYGGGERDRTDDLLLAKQALSQLSYTPITWRPAAKL
jgi:hypothetical protein